jgi:Homing endonuclease associated repeat
MPGAGCREGDGDVGSSADAGAESTAAVSPGSWEDWWPPLSYAENDHILVWWLPEYDELLRQLVADYQWAWQGGVLQRLEPLIPDDVLRAWRDSDSQCREYSWYNVLGTFAAARAKQLGIVPRPARQKVCSCCSRSFLESDLSYRLIARTGVDQIDVCHVCLRQALQDKGSAASSAEDVIAVLQALSEVLGRPPKTSDLAGRLDLRDLAHDQRVVVVQALRIKPTPARIKELFGSWKSAVAQAAAASPASLPRYQRPPLSAPSDSEFTSSDPGRYRALTGPPPEITLDAKREELDYYEEIRSLIGAGYLALAEAALNKLCERECVMNFKGLLAEICGQTARKDEARTAMRSAYHSPSADPEEPHSDSVFWPRDMRTITSGPVFYEPLRSLPRGDVCFILVGGPMEYVDRRGEHSCISGEAPPGDAAAGLAESVARMSAMVEGEPWMQAAVATGQAIITSMARAGESSGLYGHLISYVTSPFRAIVKALTGSLPSKVAEDAWSLTPAGKSRWSYQREAANYIFNASASFALMGVETAPAVCIWGWPDRSDSCLQAYLDTVAAGRSGPVFVILPDVPAYRDFARRYARREQMARSERALIEDLLYRYPPDMINKRGYILTAEFAPRLVIYPDGGETDGATLAGAIAYLDAHHTLRLSVWDLLRDDLLREAALAACPAPGTVSVTAADRADMVLWYRQLPEYDDPGILFRPYRPSLLEAVA